MFGLAAGYQIYDYQKMAAERARFVAEAEEIYSVTMGGKKPVTDPVAELRARINEIDESVVAAIVEQPEIRSVALLSDISKRMPSSVRVSFERFSFDRKKVRIDGTTEAYNDVDSIKKSLEQSPYFTAVSIDSAGTAGDGSGVKFSIIPDLVSCGNCTMTTENPNMAANKASRLQRLSRRERFMLAAGLLFVLGFAFHQLIAEPFLTNKQRLERSLQSKAANVLEMKLLQQEYQQISENKRDIMGRLQSRSPEFSLFTFVEQQIDTVRMKERVTSIKPGVSDYQEGVRQALIDLKIEGIVLAQLVDFLASIESFDKVVFVERIVVQNNSREDGLLDVMLSVLTFEIEPSS